MNTPIADFVHLYASDGKARLHMPGHKGRAFLGCEAYDITEIAGADALYEADGIIAESEKNASSLFGTARTLYSTEGSSQCIRAMLCLCLTCRASGASDTILAARNVHKSFVFAAALLGFRIQWLWPGQMTSLCACEVSAAALEQALSSMDTPPAAVYITSPDYLGGMADIRALADVCHRHGTVLAVDNAHGAYLRFLSPSLHPMDLGADICCDSAHKTLPVLTGGAYLHISPSAPGAFAAQAKQAMALFGSTSPSYLTLASLDLCNAYIADSYAQQFESNEAETLENGKILRLIADPGTTVCSAAIGQVASIDMDDKYGTTVRVHHGDGRESIYSGLDGVCVEVGQPLLAGDTIGAVDENGALYIAVSEHGETVPVLERFDADFKVT